MAEKNVPLFTEIEKGIILSSLNMKVASLDRASKGYTMGSSMFLAVRQDIVQVRELIQKIGGL